MNAAHVSWLGHQALQPARSPCESFIREVHRYKHVTLAGAHTQPGKINTTSALPTPLSEHWSRHMLKGMLSSPWREVSKVQASMC